MTISEFRGEHRFLSNFYPAPVVIQGIPFPTTEHAYQAGKTTNQAVATIIAAKDSPGAAKRAGAEIKLRDDWDEHREGWMHAVLTEKFRQHPDLMVKLLATGDEELVEGNTWHDQIWGSCTCPKHQDTPGGNLLGRLLMAIREEARHAAGEA